MPADVTTIKDEWSPTLELLLDKLSGPERRKFFGDLGMRTVGVIKNKMSRSKGFGNNRRYRKLKIKWRYHGHKEVAASKKNLARAVRGASITSEWVSASRRTRSGGSLLRERKRIKIVDKTKVTSSTKPLIDLGHLLRSWSVRKRGVGFVEFGPRTPAEAEKAYYNEDRGQWNWKTKSADRVMEDFLGYIDEGVFANIKLGGPKKRRSYGSRSHFARRFS